MTRYLTLIAFAFLPFFVSAQAIQVQCPSTPASYADFSTNSPLFWKAPYWWDALIQLNDLAEGDVNLELNFTDSCTLGATHVRYILYLDLDNNGLSETIVDSDSLPPSNTVYFGNKETDLTAGTPRQFDFRQVNILAKYGFGLNVDSIAPFSKITAVRWKNAAASVNNVVPQLPYGTHKIKWVLSNACNSTKSCTYDFTVRDTKKPTVVMVNLLSVNLMASGDAQVLASDLLQYVEDNYAPSAQIMLGVRRTGTGTGFPFNPDGTPQTVVEFDCDDIGGNEVELWGRDVSGNSDYASTYLYVKDNMAVCGDTIPCELKFYASGPTGAPIEDVSLYFAPFSPGMPTSIPALIPNPYDYSCYSISYSNGFPPLPDVTIRLYNDLDHLNGINTWDLILLKRHVLGQEPLDNPYKLIAADINKSGTITLFDRSELIKLILGTYVKFPYNTSWRFVDKNQVFPNPLNPFTQILRESLPYGQWSLQGIPLEFIGIKIGDLDNSAQLTGEVDVRNRPTTVFNFKDQKLSPLEPITLHFAPESTIEGYQMTLDLAQFELLEIIPQNDLTMNNFGVFDQALTMVTEQPNQGFDLRLRAKQAGQLSSMLAVNDKITHSVAFDAGGLSKGIVLHFNPIQKEAIQLNQNVPNPWHSATNIGFYLPEANTPVTFTVVDEMWRVVYTANNTYPSGYQSIALDESMVTQAGMYWYSLTTEKEQLVQKMVKF
jgi:hypothetical protein